ncbi:MAG: phosphopyruvate hydratase, partial [Halobacteriota archaeon]
DVLRVPLYHHLGGAFRGDTVPIPIGNVIGGGAHALGATDIQEFHAVPVGAPSVSAAAFANAAVHDRTGALLSERGYRANKGDEGAWAPQGLEDREALGLLAEAAETVAEEVGFDIELGLDVAASELYDADTGVYRYADAERDPEEQREYLAELVDAFGVIYLEDPLDEDDLDGFAAMTERVGDRTLVCGDDLFCTNPVLIERGLAREAASSVLIKPNQIGTLSDAVDAIDLTVGAGRTPVVSHRSGETEDTTIAHLTMATGAPYIKTGVVGGERTSKLNELIRISQDAT